MCCIGKISVTHFLYIFVVVLSKPMKACVWSLVSAIASTSYNEARSHRQYSLQGSKEGMDVGERICLMTRVHAPLSCLVPILVLRSLYSNKDAINGMITIRPYSKFLRLCNSLKF